MKRIAISQRIAPFPDRNELRDTLDQNLTRWLDAASYLPFPVPNTLSTESGLQAWLGAVQPCGVLLSGGGNFGEHPQRDSTEAALLCYAESHLLPVLGICRGMQMLARSRSIGLKPVSGHVRTRHKLSGEIDGEVNSYHEFSLCTCPPGFRELARSEDGEIEAIRHDKLRLEGWMWHPERESAFSSQDIQRLKVIFA